MGTSSILDKYRQEINQLLVDIYPKGPKSLTQPIQYVLNGEGKRLRPILTLFCANSCGGRTVGEKDTTSICDGVSWSAGATMLNENANTPTAASPDVSLSMMVCGGIDPSDESDLSSVQELVEGVFIARTALGTGRQNCGCAGISLSP